MTNAERISVARIVKVNHAGEYGAIRIYGAQMLLAKLRWPKVHAQLQELQSHEIEHCAIFAHAMPGRESRPCRTMFLWSMGGWVLGAVTALLGKRMVWACTEVVEHTVHQHLSAQLNFLKPLDPELHDTIQAIQAEEEGHLALAVTEKGADSRLTRAARPVIKASVEAVIWLSTWGDSAAMDRDLRARA